MNIEGLLSELRTDPLARGYATMTDAALFTSLKTLNRTSEKTSLTGAQIYNAITPSEFTSATAANQVLVRDVIGLGGDIDISTGKNARTVLLNVFNAASATRAALSALVNKSISRAEELGCADLDLAYLSYLRNVANQINVGHP